MAKSRRKPARRGFYLPAPDDVAALNLEEATADTALRLGRFFGMSSEFWPGLQAQYGLDIASAALEDRPEKEP
jgi:plasmid maintenance system antidote protein VapI